MLKDAPALRRAVAALVALIAWAGLAIELSLVIRFTAGRGLPLGWAFVIYLGYFTNLTGILVALVLSAAVLDGEGRGPLTRPRFASAAAVYIVITGIVYSLLLRSLYAPQGLRLLSESLQHDVLPPLYVAFWLVFVPKGALRLGDAVRWLAYPVGYFLYVLLRGALIGRYPYPFLDARRLGPVGLLENCALLLAGFLAAGLILVALDVLLARRSSPQATVAASISPEPASPERRSGSD